MGGDQMKDIKILDLYAGKPDAKDEIGFDGTENFIKTFVVADHHNIKQLTEGNRCFITGFKGTGKTALLFYLEQILKDSDNNTCSSFIFFKEEYTDAKRKEIQAFSKRVMSSITVEQGALTKAQEFEYIWRWVILKQIVNDNEYYNRNLFVDNGEWHAFEKAVAQIKDPRNKRKIILLNKVKFALPCKDMNSFTEYAPEIEVDFQNQSGQYYQNFVELVDMAESLFSATTRTDIPYYIFVDELEAYYGDQQVFMRDLCMIRDLVFTVKHYNYLFAQSKMLKTKMICSVRSEILTAIERFTVSKELNKVTSGFSVPLTWNYTNSNSHMHPIIQILLKRIAICSETNEFDSLKLYRQWFPEKIHDMEPANYILNNSWCKPRDIVRLITVAQNSLHNNTSAFTQDVFDAIKKSYSYDSMQEIKEELRALYTSEDIEIIISCFTGYRTSFSVKDLQERIDHYYPDTILKTKFRDVIEDLYRLGFLGNVLPATKTYHWQHKGDPSVIFADEWRLCVHYALHSALSIGSANDRIIKRRLQKGDIALVTVAYVGASFVNVEFSSSDKLLKGYIHISEFGNLFNQYIFDLSAVVHEGEQFKAILKEYNQKFSKWEMKLVIDDNESAD